MSRSPGDLTLLDPDQAVFPDPGQALTEPNGLLAVGGNLLPETLISAYQSGIFPWFEAHQPLLWWSPDPRAIIYPDQLHISKSLRKKLRAGDYQITTDCAFNQVIRACAGRRNTDDGTWITENMIQAYIALFEHGYAHSVEYWMNGELAGGLYGVCVGRIFCGESMFSQHSDASKIALAHLANALHKCGFALIDCQIGNDHLFSLGAVMIDRAEFLDLLRDNIEPEIVWPVASISAKLFASAKFDAPS